MNTFVGANRVRHLPTNRKAEAPRTIDQVRLVRDAHRPDRSRRQCQSCDFTYTDTQPYCPSRLWAERWLLANPPALAQPADTDELLKQVAAHRPAATGTHCARCGFTYTADTRECPARRDIRIELKRLSPTHTQPDQKAKRGLCFGQSRRWSINGNTPAQWRQAQAICEECPLLQTCRAEVLAQAGKPPLMIVAGLAFDNRGKVVDDLDLFARKRTGGCRQREGATRRVVTDIERASKRRATAAARRSGTTSPSSTPASLAIDPVIIDARGQYALFPVASNLTGRPRARTREHRGAA